MGIPCSIEELDDIKAECIGIVKKRAVASGTAAIIPGFGLDIVADIAIFSELIPRINREFGLTKDQIDQLDNHTKKTVLRTIQKVSANQLKGKILSHTVYKDLKASTMKRLSASIFKKQAGKQATKTISKFVPFIGPAVSASIGYMSIIKAGNDHIEDCCILVKEIIKEKERQDALAKENTKKGRAYKLFPRVIFAIGILVVSLVFISSKFNSPINGASHSLEVATKIKEGNKKEEIDKGLHPSKPTIQLLIANNKIRVQQSIQLQVKILGLQEGTPEKIEFTSSNPAIADISQQGVITGKSIGDTTISANAFGESASIKIEVSDIIWSANIEGINEKTNVTWSNDGKWIGMDSYLIDGLKGTMKKQYEGHLQFYSKGLIEFYGDFLKLYDEKLLPIEEIRLVDKKDYYAGYGIKVEKNNQKVTRDGTKLVFTGYDDEKKLFNLLTKKIEMDYKVNWTNLGSLDISSDDKQIIFGTYDKEVYVMDLESGKPIQTLKSEETSRKSIINTKGTQLANLSYDKNSVVNVWNIKSGIIENSFNRTDEITDIAYSQDGKLLAASSKDGNIYIYETTKYQLVNTLKSEYNKQQKKSDKSVSINEVSNISFSPSGKDLLAIYNNLLNKEPSVILWDIKTWNKN